MPLLTALARCRDRSHAPFYTPGHKGGRGASPQLLALFNAKVLRCDLPELPELDNLFAPESVIQAAQVLAAEAFGAEQTWFLTNGSTCGVMAAILATCHPGDQIILPRNIHRSAISGLILSGAMPIFLEPDYDADWTMAYGIAPGTVQQALARYPQAKAVMMVYPTYEGVCGDIAAIAQIAHHHHIPLLVDEAHGAHLAFHTDLPSSALAAGADLSVQSTHKVLGAMTQAAMLHIQGDRIEGDRLSQALQLLQSTSPNYLLLASLDAARHQIAGHGNAILANTLTLAQQAREQIQAIPQLSVLTLDSAHPMPGLFALDPTRLTVMLPGLGLDGFALDAQLHQTFGVTAELPTLTHITFALSLGNTAVDIENLVAAFKQVAKDHSPLAVPKTYLWQTDRPRDMISTPALTPRQAHLAPKARVPSPQAVYRISAELVCPYPPGIPILWPGEVIQPTDLDFLQQVCMDGGILSGCSDPSLRTLQVVEED